VKFPKQEVLENVSSTRTSKSKTKSRSKSRWG